MDIDLVETMSEIEIVRRRFTVTELLHLSETGFLGDDERVELISGEIVEMSPINVAHASTVSRLIAVIYRSLNNRIVLSVQNPIKLDEEMLLQPDLAVLKLRDDYYSKQHPGPDSILLLIEVSDTTHQYDRRVKSKLYGAAGIADYWIVNLPARRIEVYREPRSNGYRTVTHYAPDETLSPSAFPDVVLNVDEILGSDA